MYPRLLLNLYERSIYRASRTVGLNITRTAYTTVKREEKTEIVSEKFPDYKVLYIFPFVKKISSVNILKRKFTILNGIGIPVSIGLSLTGILTVDTTITLITTGLTITLWQHTLGLLCNNLVGYIYWKSDDGKVILSYIDYWGNRVDLKTSTNEINFISDNPTSFTDPLYKKIILPSQKLSLKINLKHGQIVDIENFRCIIGGV
ncbi:hypothetical protein PUN28_015561 [Cardiocondyla obscurior]|uniref:Transmembrane protein 186 n=1 Tax=Cardiocondyla obscurior TaxID=286306 RepID=A0AAW2EUV5_9HYME